MTATTATTDLDGGTRHGGRLDVQPGLLLAELSLLVVHLAVVFGFGRLYRGGGLGDLVVFTVVAHGLAAAARRLRLPLPVAIALGTAGAALVATWTLFPETTRLWMPSATTIDQARQAISVATDEFKTVVAPTSPLPGFQLVAGLSLWGAAWFADWSAFRVKATAEALVPATILFVFCTVLGTGDHRFSSAVLFAGSAILFAANHRAHLAELDRAWLATSPSTGAAWVRRSILGMGATVVVAGVVIAPMVPGYDDDALMTWRNKERGAGLRTTVSPIVDLRRRLVAQTNREMFRVEADVPSYWRLTSLHEFDGKIWSSGGEYGQATERLPSAGPTAASAELITQRVKVQTLSAIWAPAAFQARVLLDHSRALSWNPDSSTLIVDSSSDDSNGVEYTVLSERPILDPDLLEQAADADPQEVLDRYLSLPDDLPAVVRREALRATLGATSRYQQAKALQDHFQDGSFTYTTDIDPGHGNDALVTFLEERRGYCEQFAGAYAAMARSLGIPARVAVGFTEGERDPMDPSTFQVRGVNAHAWPEVYFSGHGWVPFEPTPGRGIPGAERYTGLAPQQAEPAETGPTASTAPETSTTVAPAPTTTQPPPDEVPVRGTASPPTSPDEANRWWSIGRWAGALATSWLVAVLVAPRLRAGTRRRARGRAAVLGAWDDALDPLRWSTGARPRPSESHAEFARRVAPLLDGRADHVAALAELAERASWAGAPMGDETVARAVELAGLIRSDLVSRQAMRSRIRRRLSWREAFGLAGTRTPRSGSGFGAVRTIRRRTVV